MKGVVVTSGLDISVRDFGEPLFKTVGAAVGGDIEHIAPQFLESPFCMIVNDEGLLRKFPLNIYGSILYGTPMHGVPIVGDVVIMKDGFNDNGEPDIVGLTDQEAAGIMKEAELLLMPYRAKGENKNDQRSQRYSGK